jgi:hypothetical protein
MSENLLIALFTVFGSWCLLHSGMIWSSKQDIKKMVLAMELYFKKMEAAALEVLHSPNDHLGLDYYIDKYRQGHSDMTDEEWLEFHEKCERLSSDPTVTAEEKLAAAQFLAIFGALVSLHKLSRVPPELRDRLMKNRK